MISANDVITLYCFPYTGGGVSVYRNWQAYLPATVKIEACQLPGREECFDEKPFESFNEVMAYVYVTLIPAISTPYALFGHSMGARIAFEFAREMRRRQLLSPVRLCVTGANAPQTTNFKPPYIHQLPDDELFAFLREFGGPEEFFHDIELQKFFIPLLRSDFKAAESYRYHHEPPLSCPISVWGGTDDIFTTLSDSDLHGLL